MEREGILRTGEGRNPAHGMKGSLMLLILGMVAAVCMAGEYSYSPRRMSQRLHELVVQHPEVLSLDTIGHSTGGRPLEVLRMGHGAVSVVVLASTHGREYVSTTLVMKDIEGMMASYAEGNDFHGYDVKEMLRGSTVYLMPMYNPDGVAIAQFDIPDYGETLKDYPLLQRDYGYACWKANGRGVDLNRNFGAGWHDYEGQPVPSSENYKGTSPFSEPETRALVSLLKEVKPEALLSYHSQEETLYVSMPRPGDRDIVEKVAALTGYVPIEAGTPYGSMQDHVDAVHGILYINVELCPYTGPFPFPEDRFESEVWEKAAAVLPLVVTELIKRK